MRGHDGAVPTLVYTQLFHIFYFNLDGRARRRKADSLFQHRTDTTQIEVENMEQLRVALDAGAKLILLDNFNLDDMRTAVKLTADRAELEASGGITLTTVRAIAETGVDRISIGSLTKDVQAVDLSMRFVKD